MATFKTPPTPESAFNRMADLCARSEQCEADIRQKLYRLGMPSWHVQEVISRLKDERFIDNARFARSFARDKCRFSAWGRNKIRLALMAKRISATDIAEGLAAIDPQDYNEALKRVVISKAKTLEMSGPEERENRIKLFRHILSRGFESELASRAVRTFTSSRNS